MPAAARDLRTCADSDLIDMDACKFFLLPILFYFSHELFLSQVFFCFGMARWSWSRENHICSDTKPWNSIIRLSSDCSTYGNNDRFFFIFLSSAFIFLFWKRHRLSNGNTTFSGFSDLFCLSVSLEYNGQENLKTCVDMGITKSPKSETPKRNSFLFFCLVLFASSFDAKIRRIDRVHLALSIWHEYFGNDTAKPRNSESASFQRLYPKEVSNSMCFLSFCPPFFSFHRAALRNDEVHIIIWRTECCGGAWFQPLLTFDYYFSDLQWNKNKWGEVIYRHREKIPCALLLIFRSFVTNATTKSGKVCSPSALF